MVRNLLHSALPFPRPRDIPSVKKAFPFPLERDNFETEERNGDLYYYYTNLRFESFDSIDEEGIKESLDSGFRDGGVRTRHKLFLVSPREKRRKEGKKRREAKWRPLLWPLPGPRAERKMAEENIFRLGFEP